MGAFYWNPLDTTDDILRKIRELKSQFNAYHGRIDSVRAFTRLREKPKIALFGGEVEPARLARANAIVTQARSFIQAAAVTIEVEPMDNSANEDTITSKLERWLYGAQYAVTDDVGNVYRDALWHYFESGQWIVRTLFDLDLAIQGKFPFCVEAIDPRTFSFKKSSKGLMYAAIEERKQAEVVQHELNYYYKQAKSPVWQIPDSLKQKRGNETVTVCRYYDDENETLYVDNNLVWTKAHLMPRVPFDIAFCNDVPAAGDHPEEFGLGLIYPILDLLTNESKLMTKMITPVELFFYPSMGVRTGDAYEIKQAYPGQRWGVGTEAPSPTTITPTPNYQVIDELEKRMEADISRATFPEAVFGPMDVQLSGYAYTQAMSGLTERLKDYAREPERAMARHFSMLLWAVSNFTDNALIQELSLTNEQQATYLRSFTVVMSSPTNSYKKVKTRVELKQEEIEGHAIVRVTLQPNMDRDESAKYQRAAMAKTQLGLPDEYIWRTILKIESPDDVTQWQNIEQLKQTNPEFGEFMSDDHLNQVLTMDKEMAKRFEMWRAAKQLVMNEAQQQQAQQGIDPNTGQPVDPSQQQGQPGQQGPGAPGQIDPNTLNQIQQGGQTAQPGMLPQGPQVGSTMPGTGGSGMPPAEAQQLSPSDLQQQLLAQRMGGGQ